MLFETIIPSRKATREYLRHAGHFPEASGSFGALLLEGLQSGEPIPVNREFWQGLRAEAQRLVEAGPDQKKIRNKK